MKLRPREMNNNFYPRSPCGERRPDCRGAPGRHDFYPRSPCGERQANSLLFLESALFLSTLSLRRATGNLRTEWPTIQISIHALLAESDAEFFCVVYVLYISIHALLAESDLLFCRDAAKSWISIHALLAESDFRQNYECFQWIKFLSTLSLRRATAAGRFLLS